MPSSDPADVKKVAAIVWIRVQMERFGISMDELEAAGCFDWEAAPARAPAEEPIVEESETDVAQARLPAGPITAPPALLPAGPITAPPVVAPEPSRKAVARKRAPAPVRESAQPAVPVAAPIATPIATPVAAPVAAPVADAVAVAEAVPAEKPAAALAAEPAATPAAAPAPARVTMSVPVQKAGAVKPAAPAAAPAQAAEAAAAPAAAAPAPAVPQASAPARRYRNAEGQVWDGVGPMPAWLLRAVNAGQSVEHFRVN
ncbi:H-NS family nucleoid-associated regulatory protein [Cupriavidus basilensis]|nr:H-NS histone family protein [Cupriavidus basilensis]